jgi:hypothetical protein
MQVPQGPVNWSKKAIKITGQQKHGRFKHGHHHLGQQSHHS